MNVHVSKEIIDKWPAYEFLGVPRKSKFGFTYINAFHKILDSTFFYIFEADSFVDKEGIIAGCPECIFNTPISK